MAIQFETAVRMLAYLRANNPVELKTVAEVFNLKSAEVRKYCDLLNEAKIGEYYGELAEVEIVDDGDGIWIEARESLGLDKQIRFTPDESIALIGGLKYLEAMPFLVEQKKVAELLLKLQATFATTESIIEIGATTVNQQIVSILRDAISQKMCVEITYGAAIDQKVTHRIIEPVAIQANEGAVSVRAFCRSSEDMRTFRVDRILEAVPVNEPGNSQVASSADFAISSPTIQARLRMLPEMLESFAPETVSEITQTENFVEATVSVTSGSWLSNLALASAGDIEVLSPQELREQVREKARKWLQG